MKSKLTHRAKRNLLEYVGAAAMAAPVIGFAIALAVAIANPHGATSKVLIALFEASPF